MKSFFRNTFVAVAVTFSVTAIAAGLLTKAEVNQKIADLLAPYATENTKAALTFTDLNFDSEKVLDFGVTGLFWAKGNSNELRVELKDVEYHYNDGKNPTAKGQLSLEIDLVKLFGQPFLDAVANGLEEAVVDIAASYTEKYGNAANVTAVVEKVEKDSEGHVVKATMNVKVDMDFSQLPAGLDKTQVEFKSGTFSFTASQKGLYGQVTMNLNPEFEAFAAEEAGLKVYLDKLVNEDQETYNDIVETVEGLLGFANGIVNSSNPQIRQ